MIITRKGSLMPRVALGSAGQVMKFVDTFVPISSSTDDWMSPSVMRLMCPLRTDSSSSTTQHNTGRRKGERR